MGLFSNLTERGKGLMKLNLAVTAIGGAALIAFYAITGGAAVSGIPKAEADLNTKASTVLHTSAKVKSELPDYVGFEYVNADVSKIDENKCKVDISGIASTSDENKVAYTTIKYTVNSDYFESSKSGTLADRINTLAEIVEKEEYDEIDMSIINNKQQFDEAVKSVSKDSSKGDLYNNKICKIMNFETDSSDNSVSFTIDQFSKFSRPDLTYHAPNNLGKPSIRLVNTTYRTAKKVTINLTEEQFKNVQADPAKAFEYFTENVKENKTDLFSTIDLQTEVTHTENSIYGKTLEASR